jgi:uncharacterized protein
VSSAKARADTKAGLERPAAAHLGISNGRLEALKSKVRLLSHRAYGFHSATALIAMIYLCSAGIQIALPHRQVTPKPRGEPEMMGGCRSARHGRYRWALLGLAVVCVLAGCGSSQTGSTIAGPAFPSTPAGVQARWLLQAPSRLPISLAEARTHVSPVLLGNSTQAEINSDLGKFGLVHLVSVTSSRANAIAFLVSVRGGERFRFALTVDARGLISNLPAPREIPPTASPASVIPPLASGWVAQSVTFQAGGVTIYGTYTHPSNTHPSTVTDPNGNNVEQPNRNTLQAVANWLSADGVASLRYDKLGSGQTGWGRYAGHPEQVGLKTYEQEAVAAVSFLARQPQVNPSRMAAVGHSLGGEYALLLATGQAAHAPKIHAVVLLEPVPARILSFFVPAPGTVSPRLRQSFERAVASLRRTGALPGGLPAAVANSLNPSDWGTQLEISQIDRYDPATLAAKLPPSTAVLLTCSNADQYFTCSMEDGIAAAVAKANAKIDFVHLDGVDHILEEDVARDPAVWNQALPFSTQPQAALRTFAAENL